MNNINVDAMTSFVDAVKDDAGMAQKHKEVSGDWRFGEGEPQFAATLSFSNGTLEVHSELPDFMGGWGNSPDPVQYCLYGLAACFAASFAAAAAEEGVSLTKLSVKAENWMDLHKQIGLSGDDIIKNVKFTVSAEGAPEDQLSRVLELARQRCPGVECITRSMPLEIDLAS